MLITEPAYQIGGDPGSFLGNAENDDRERREAAETGAKTALLTNDPVEVFTAIAAQAEETLQKTPELLPVLKKAGVVDAGGKGLCIVYRGDARRL